MSLLNWISPPVSSRQILALAGVAQSIVIIDELAQRGTYPEHSYATNLQALLELDPKDDHAIFGQPGDLILGLNVLKSLLSGEQQSGKMVYLTQILYLQRKLSQQPKVIDQVQTGLRQSQRQAEFSGLQSDAIALSIGDLYLNTLSKLGSRIQIKGNQDILVQDTVAARIRTMLFSAVRYATLWHQIGGSTRQFVMSKKTMLTLCEEQLKIKVIPENNDASN